MTTTVFVLLMLWSTGDYRGGLAVVQQEFNSHEACEIARVELAKAHNGGGGGSGSGRVLAAQGCFRK